MLLIRQYKVCLVSSSSACSNSAGILSTPYAFFDFNSFNAFSNSAFVIVGPSSSGVISSLSSSSSYSGSSYNSSMYCCHLSPISSSSTGVFPSFDSIIACFNLGFPKNFLIRLYDFSVFPRLSWFSVSSQFCPSRSFFIFLKLSIYKISNSVIFTFIFIMFVFSSLFY